MRVTLIAAVAANGVIGRDGEMPWHYPADLARFRERTLGHPVILGRVTHETILERLDGPLPGRTSIVLTSDPARVDTTHPDVRAATGVEAALERAREAGTGEAFVAGGGSVYEQFLPVADRMLLTEIHESVEGDTTFPELDETEWVETGRETHEDLSFVTYRHTSSQ